MLQLAVHFVAHTIQCGYMYSDVSLKILILIVESDAHVKPDFIRFSFVCVFSSSRVIDHCGLPGHHVKDHDDSLPPLKDIRDLCNLEKFM